MRKLLLILILLLIALPAQARMNGYIAGASQPSTSCTISGCSGAVTCTGATGCSFRETMEDGAQSFADTTGTGCSNDNQTAWTDSGGSGTLNSCYATSPAPLQGTQSVLLYSAEQRRHTVTGTTEQVVMTGVFRFVDETSANNSTIASIQNATSALTLAGIILTWSTDHWYAKLTYHNGTSTVTTPSSDPGTYTVDGGETWYFKLVYKAASASPGNDGIAKLYLSSNGTSWNVTVAEITNHNQDDQPTRLQLNNDVATQLIIDDVRYTVDNTDINYW